jgi:hypothetical protein
MRLNKNNAKKAAFETTQQLYEMIPNQMGLSNTNNTNDTDPKLRPKKGTTGPSSHSNGSAANANGQSGKYMFDKTTQGTKGKIKADAPQLEQGAGTELTRYFR